jgi:hypothetical protein
MPFYIKPDLLSKQPECTSWPFCKLFSYKKKPLHNDLDISSSISLVIIRTNPRLLKTQANKLACPVGLVCAIDFQNLFQNQKPFSKTFSKTHLFEDIRFYDFVTISG